MAGLWQSWMSTWLVCVQVIQQFVWFCPWLKGVEGAYNSTHTHTHTHTHYIHVYIWDECGSVETDFSSVFYLPFCLFIHFRLRTNTVKHSQAIFMGGGFKPPNRFQALKVQCFDGRRGELPHLHPHPHPPKKKHFPSISGQHSCLLIKNK